MKIKNNTQTLLAFGLPGGTKVSLFPRQVSGPISMRDLATPSIQRMIARKDLIVIQ